MKSRTKKHVIMMEVLTALVVLAILSSMGVPRFPERMQPETSSADESATGMPEPVNRGIDGASRTGDALPADGVMIETISDPGSLTRPDGVPDEEPDDSMKPAQSTAAVQ